MEKKTLTVKDVLDLPTVVDVPTAGRALGIGVTTAYRLARAGSFPCRVIHAGAGYRVPAAELIRVLGISPDLTDPQPDDPAREGSATTEQHLGLEPADPSPRARDWHERLARREHGRPPADYIPWED